MSELLYEILAKIMIEVLIEHIRENPHVIWQILHMARYVFAVLSV